MFLSVAFFIILPLVAASYDATNIRALFGLSLSSEAEIFLPSYTNWTEDVQQRWTTWEAPSYIGAIKAATVEDVQKIVSRITIDPQLDWEFTEYEPRSRLRQQKRYRSLQLGRDMAPRRPMAGCMVASISISVT